MKAQRGSVIIITLWTVTLLTILVAVLAGDIRLSARAAYYQQEEFGNWAKVVSAVNQAEMELMLEQMPPPVTSIEDLEEIDRSPYLRFNGQALELAYPVAEGITVRVYDHAGKINLRDLNRVRWRELLEKQLGEEADQEIEEMLQAWTDWVDLNQNSTVNGAEDDYYQSLDDPYLPRNAQIESVEEILLIRGFGDVFADVDLDAAFTLYTDDDLINLNLATREAMELLPGLDDELIEEIMLWRQENEFRGNGDVAQIVPEENMADLRRWLNSRKTSNFYTIMAYPTMSEAQGSDDELEEGTLTDVTAYSYAETVQIESYNTRPKILKVNPYEKIPAKYDVVQEEE